MGEPAVNRSARTLDGLLTSPSGLSPVTASVSTRNVPTYFMESWSVLGIPALIIKGNSGSL